MQPFPTLHRTRSAEFRAWDQLTDYGQELLARFGRDGDEAALQEAIRCYTTAAEMSSKGVGDATYTFLKLARAFFNRFELKGDRADLAEAIAYNESALKVTPPGQAEHLNCLGSLANTLLARFEHVGDRVDLDAAIAHYQATGDLTPPGSPFRSRFLGNLANALQTRFEQIGDIVDLDAAIVHNQVSLHAHPDRAYPLNNLATALIARFEYAGDLRDLDAAISHCNAALQLRLPGHPDRSRILNNVANALIIRSEQTGDRADLDESISHYWLALELQLPGHLFRSSSMNNLATALITRFQQLGDHVDLDTTISLLRTALELIPPSNPYRSTYLNNLASALQIRFGRVAGSADMDEAITHHQVALQLRPPGHPNRHESLSNLASALVVRFWSTRDRANLDAAITHHRAALKLRSTGHPDRSSSLGNLANALLARFEHASDPMDLNEAIFHCRRAADLTPRGHPLRSKSLERLASALFTLSSKTEEYIIQNHSASILCPDDPQRQILEMLEEATSIMTGGPPKDCLRASLAWVDVASKWSHPSAVKAYQVCLTLLETIVASGSSLEARHSSLTSAGIWRTQSLAVDAAACAIATGQIEIGLELLEQGRTMLLTEAGRYRTRIDDLATVSPDLASEFKTLSLQMERFVLSDDPLIIAVPSPKSDDGVARYQKLSEKWTVLLEQIRRLDGFQSFLMPIPFQSLREAAAGGPVVVINISLLRSDAIIIGVGAPPSLVYLPEATPLVLSGLLEMTTSRSTSMKFQHALQRLWKIIVQPVVTVLQKDFNLPHGSRIWWCPTGAASLLPLHAAGEYTTRGPVLPNIYISSYTTTLGSLIKSRGHRFRSQDDNRKLLVVGQPNVPGQAELPSVKLELSFLRSSLPSSTILEDADGTREAILNAMVKHEWLHITCHGHVNQQEPFKSHFAVIDGQLTFREIVKYGLPRAEIAFLSSCDSASGNRNRSDEALHLVAALQFAGFKSVVGTLWEMDDGIGYPVTARFWSVIQSCHKEGEDATTMSAKALHSAVNVLRKSNVSVVDWACLVHYGC